MPGPDVLVRLGLSFPSAAAERCAPPGALLRAVPVFISPASAWLRVPSAGASRLILWPFDTVGTRIPRRRNRGALEATRTGCFTSLLLDTRTTLSVFEAAHFK